MFLDLVLFLAIGLFAGWLAGFVLRGRGFGWRTNLLVGLVGAIAGGVVLPFLGLNASGFIGKLLMATVGAIAVLLAAAFLLKPIDGSQQA